MIRADEIRRGEWENFNRSDAKVQTSGAYIDLDDKAENLAV